MNDDLGALMHGPGEGEVVEAFGQTYRFRVAPEATGGALALFEDEVPEGSGPPLHRHTGERELFVVLEGRVRIHCEGREREMGPGGSALIPPGAVHAFRGLGPGPSRLLVTLIPGGGAALFRAVAAEGLRMPDDAARVVELAAAHGMEIVGPPLGQG